MFFSATRAQIVPVLLVVLAIEARIFALPADFSWREPRNIAPAVNAAMILFLLAGSEVEQCARCGRATLPMATPASSSVACWLAGFVAIALLALTPRRSAQRPQVLVPMAGSRRRPRS